MAQLHKEFTDIHGMACNDMALTHGGQSFVTAPPVSAKGAARFHALLHRWYQTLCSCIKYPLKTDTANMVAFIFDCNKNQRLTCCTTAPFPWPFTSDIRFIYLHRTRQSITTRAYHGSAKFMEPYPYCFVPWDSQNSLKSHGTDAILLVHHVPHRPEPQLEGFPCILKDSSCGYRGFVSTLHAVIQIALGQPHFIILTARASKTIRPSQIE